MKLALGQTGTATMAEGDKLVNTVRDLKRVKANAAALKERVAVTVAQNDAAHAKISSVADAMDAEVKDAEALLSELGSNFGPELDELEVAPPKKGLFSSK